MRVESKKVQARLKRRRGIRKKIMGTSDRLRVSIYRSHKNIYVQLINDFEGKTILGISTKSKDLKIAKGGNLEAAKTLGKKVAEEAKKNGFKSVVFDRGGYQYRGRVKAVADALREFGLQV